MSKFNIGDKIYGGDWLYGTILDIIHDDESGEDLALVEFETDRGGGTISVALDKLTKVEPKEMKVVKIEGCFEIPKDMDLEDFNDAFIKWVESQNCFFGGGLVEEKEKKTNVEAKPTFYQWLNSWEFMTKREFKELPKYKKDNYRTEYEMFLKQWEKEREDAKT